VAVGALDSADPAVDPPFVGRSDDFFPRVAALLVNAAVTRQKVAAVAEELGVPQGQVKKWLARAVDEGLLVKKSKGYSAGAREPSALSSALPSRQALHDAGTAAAESLDIATLRQSEAVERIATTFGVDPPLAKMWLADAAAKLSQPLFVVGTDAPAVGDVKESGRGGQS
jgi:hypothetical protein